MDHGKLSMKIVKFTSVESFYAYGISTDDLSKYMVACWPIATHHKTH